MEISSGTQDLHRYWARSMNRAEVAVNTKLSQQVAEQRGNPSKATGVTLITNRGWREIAIKLKSSDLVCNFVTTFPSGSPFCSERKAHILEGPPFEMKV